MLEILLFLSESAEMWALPATPLQCLSFLNQRGLHVALLSVAAPPLNQGCFRNPRVDRHGPRAHHNSYPLSEVLWGRMRAALQIPVLTTRDTASIKPGKRSAFKPKQVAATRLYSEVAQIFELLLSSCLALVK